MRASANPCPGLVTVGSVDHRAVELATVKLNHRTPRRHRLRDGRRDGTSVGTTGSGRLRGRCGPPHLRVTVGIPCTHRAADVIAGSTSKQRLAQPVDLAVPTSCSDLAGSQYMLVI